MEETISLKEISHTLKKRWLMIISFSLIAVIISAVVSLFILTPKYQATAQFIVSTQNNGQSNQVDVNDIKTNVELINTYNVIIKSDRILNAVNEELEFTGGSSWIREKLEITNEKNSQVVNVNVNDSNQENASKLANTIVKEFKEEVPNLMNVDNVNILTEAQVVNNARPISPKPMLNLLIALILGLMLGVGTSFLLEYLDQTINSEEDINSKLDLSVLGVISHIDESDVKDSSSNSFVSKRSNSYEKKQKKTI
ncbi:YveK family protein [Pontibacillus salicampi]|uniref:YveK family protein n=1 Tax=Pontibacillus salicampi TaxID=1449801 RepID=A0ABV6LSI7_9BACI